MEHSNAQQLVDIIALLTKVSDKLADKVDKKADKRIAKVDKLTGVKKEDNADKKVAKTVDVPEKKPEEVVKEDQPVLISSFGKKATESLKEVFGFKKEEKKDDKKEEAKSWLDKLLGPGTLLIFGAIGGFIAALMKGGFGDIIKKFQGGDYKGALEAIGAKIYQVFKPILHGLPIIGPLLSLWDAYTAFENGNIIDGMNNLLQGAIGLFVPAPFSFAIFAGMDILEAFLENKFPKVKIPKGAGSEIIAVTLHAFGLFASKLKFLPIIGSLFDFYDAYNAFKGGGTAGIVDGLLALTAGIAGFFPGAGTAISIGVDIIRALIFGKQKDAAGKEHVVVRNWAQDLWGTITEAVTTSFPIRNLIQFADGIADIVESGGSWEQIKSGLLKISYAVPGVGGIIGFFGGPDTADKAIDPQDSSAKTQSVFGTMVDWLKKKALNLIPESVFGFALRSRVAKLFGVDLGEPKDDESVLKAAAVAGGNAGGAVAAVKSTNKATPIESGAMQGLPVDDFIKAPNGQLIQPNKDDTIMGFKPDGPLDNYFSNAAKFASENTDVLKNLTDITSSLWNKQLKILDESRRYLSEIKENITNIQPSMSVSNNVSNNISGQSKGLRDIQEAFVNNL